MASQALAGRLKKIGKGLYLRSDGRRSGPVASDADDGLMGAFQREARRAVIEGPQFFPLTQIVAGLARFLGSMRVGVATCASQFRKMVLARGCRCSGWKAVMTICANHRCVRSRQSETSLAMTNQRERRGPKSILRVTNLATVFMRRRLELTRMRIGMTTHARACAKLVVRFFAFRLVALNAFDRRVFALQRKGATLMFFAGK